MRHSIHTSVLVMAVMGGLGLATDAMADPGGYIGGAYGREKMKDSDFKDDINAKKIYLGGKFNDYIGIEASVDDYGKVKNNIYTADIKGKTLSLVGYLPLTKSFELFAKGGQLWWDADVAVLNVLDKSYSGTEPVYGAGMQFNFNPTLSMRLEYQRYKINLTKDEVGVNVNGNSTADVASVGLQMNF